MLFPWVFLLYVMPYDEGSKYLIFQKEATFVFYFQHLQTRRFYSFALCTVSYVILTWWGLALFSICYIKKSNLTIRIHHKFS